MGLKHFLSDINDLRIHESNNDLSEWGKDKLKEYEFILTELAELKKLRVTDVSSSLPTIEQIEAWAKEQAKIEPTGAEEFGRIWGAMWMRGLIDEKLKGNDY